jgi:HEAT repeat protein
MSNPAVVQYIGALSDSNLRARLQAVGDLVTIGAPAVEPLIASLEDTNPEVRWRALVALGWIGDTRAIEPLLDALSDTIWEVRQNAAWALGHIGDIRASEGLYRAAHDDDEQVCVLAAYALARMNDAVRLQSCLSETGERIRRAANAALSLLANDAQLVRQHTSVKQTAAPTNTNRFV